MIDVRQFIRDMGDGAAEFFNTKPETVKRWIKTGNVPMKAAQKVFNAYETISKQVIAGSSQQFVGELLSAPPSTPPQDSNEDPMTHLPKDINRRLPEIVAVGGAQLPATIEISPTEQSFGNNLTRPGRVSARPMPPMKLRDEGGQKVAYVDNTPKTPTVLPPTMRNEGWANAQPAPPAPPATAAPTAAPTPPAPDELQAQPEAKSVS